MKKIIAASAGLLLVGSMVSAAHADVTFTGDARERFLMEDNYSKNSGESDYDYGRVRLGVDSTTKGGAFMSARLIITYNDFSSGTGAPISPGGTTISTTSTGAVSNNPLNTYKAGTSGATVTSQGANVNNLSQNGMTNNQSPLTDFAYIGIPIGPVTITVGRMPDYSSVWFRYDKRLDGAAATYATKTTSVSLMYAAMDNAVFDGYNPTNAATTATQNEDVNQWAIIAKQKFVADWSGMFYGIYQDDQRAPGSWSLSGNTALNSAGTAYYYLPLYDSQGFTPSGSGFQGTMHAEGPVGPVKLMGEFSFAQKNLAMPDSTWYASDLAPTYRNGSPQYEDGYGGVFHAKMDVGPATGTFVIGFTRDGFQADGNYGFLMMGGAMGGANPDLPNIGSPITAINRIGANPANPAYAANTFFTGLIGDYEINKTFKLVGILADANITGYGNAVELSGLVNIKVTDGAYINVGAGLLGKSLDNSLNNISSTSGNPEAASNYVSTHNDTDYAVFSELGIKF